MTEVLERPISGGWVKDSRGTVESYVNPNAHCPVCGAAVYFYRSPYDGRVFFDELGWPWPKHPCTDNRREPLRATRRSVASVAPRGAPAWRGEGWHPLLASKVYSAEDRLQITGDLNDQFQELYLTTGEALDAHSPIFVRAQEGKPDIFDVTFLRSDHFGVHHRKAIAFRKRIASLGEDTILEAASDDATVDGHGQLPPAERKLLEACAKGEPASIDTALRPMRRTDENHIRAQFLRFLVLGGDERAPVHEKGVHICGAWIDGDVDLEACHVTVPITLDWCYVDGNINLLDAETPCLFLDNSFAKRIDAKRLRCAGSVHLNNATSVAGGVSMVGAQVGGDIDCDDTYFGDKNGTSFDCSGTEIRGNVFLGREGNDNRSLHAAGKVNFLGSRIHGGLLCNAARFEGPVWIIGTHITGDLDLSLCNFTDGPERSEIILSRSEIEGRFFFRKATGTAERIVMRATTVAFLGDDLDSWKIANQLFLDGFQYGRFIDAYLMDEPPVWTHHISPTDADGRIAWLARELEFKPHPWEQLAKVLREIGDQEGAKKVAIAKQERIRKSTHLSALVHWLYGISCCYGYRPQRLILWAIGVAVVWAVLFKIAGSAGVMAPTDRRIFDEVKDIACRPEHGGNWTTCPTLHRRGYPSFDPIVYSIDLILPVIATQQTKDWAPLTTEPCRDINSIGLCKDHFPASVISSASGYWLPWGVFFWLMARGETLLGWIFGLLFVAIVAGIVKKD